MHATLLALTLAAYLLAPGSFLARLWTLSSGHAAASPTLDKAGPGLDPDGAPAPAPTTKEGPGLDPFGVTAPAPTTEAGPGLDPSGHS
jgi:hypothetical protein